MIINLTDTSSSDIAAALLKARHNLGNASGMVLTLIVQAERRALERVYSASQIAAREHPSRLILVVNHASKTTKMDAEVHLAEDVPGEVIVLHLSGDLRAHADSAVLPLLLPDSPVVMWWPGRSPVSPGKDQLGALANRRITDAAGDISPISALLIRAENHIPGDTDLTWTRLTRWRALLAAALDQYPVRVTGATVSASRTNAPAQLMAAWLEDRLKVDVVLRPSSGPGITAIALETPGGDILVARGADGVTADYSVPGQPRRTVALKRRDINELLTEELRRMDADEIYEAATHALLARARRLDAADETPASPGPARKAAASRTGATSGSRAGKGSGSAQASANGNGSGPQSADEPDAPGAEGREN